jgi:uncharacterized membrane-anchored protein
VQIKLKSGKLDEVAEITVGFWLMKIVAITLGETFGIFLKIPIVKCGLDMGTLKPSLVSISIITIRIIISHRKSNKKIVE